MLAGIYAFLQHDKTESLSKFRGARALSQDLIHTRKLRYHTQTTWGSRTGGPDVDEPRAYESVWAHAIQLVSPYSRGL